MKAREATRSRAWRLVNERRPLVGHLVDPDVENDASVEPVKHLREYGERPGRAGEHVVPIMAGGRRVTRSRASWLLEEESAVRSDPRLVEPHVHVVGREHLEDLLPDVAEVGRVPGLSGPSSRGCRGISATVLGQREEVLLVETELNCGIRHEVAPADSTRWATSSRVRRPEPDRPAVLVYEKDVLM